ncbi:MAG: universal stress protein [Burkholderiaceae bacterium]|nr:universal stress protein [Burkholderiaceae bacterium]
MYKRILVATDGSSLAQKAVDSAIELAALCGAELIALRVVPRYPQSYFEGSIPLSAEDVARVEKQWGDDGRATVESVKAAGEARGVKVNPILAKSDIVSDALITAAKTHDVDLIVMASHGRKGVKRLLLGSETMQVLTHSETPVLVLR